MTKPKPIRRLAAAMLVLALASTCWGQWQGRVPPERVKRVPTVADLATAKPHDGDVIALEGYQSSQDGGGQLLVYDRDSGATPNGVFTFDGPGSVGRYLAIERDVIIAERAGLVGDDSTDNRARLQAIIDGILNGTITSSRIIVLTTGKSYVLSGPVVIGRLSGGVWQQIIGITIAAGESTAFYDDGGLNTSATLRADFTDGPILILQRCRRITLSGIRFRGKSNFATLAGGAYVLAGSTNYYTDKLGTESNFNPVTNPARENRYSPSCGIAIDPFGSAVPAIDYYPAYSAAEYVGSSGSSAIRLRGLSFRDTNVGVGIGFGTTANGAEIVIDDSHFLGVKYGVSTSHAQNKSIFLRTCHFSDIWGCVVGNEHGGQQGVLPFMDNCHGGLANHLVAASTTFQTTRISGGLWELILRLSDGAIGKAFGAASSSSEAPVLIESVNFNTAGDASYTEPFMTLGAAPLTVHSCNFTRGNDTRKWKFALPSTDYKESVRLRNQLTNIYGTPLLIERCRFAMSSATAVANVIETTGEDRWLEFRNSYVHGDSVSPFTRMMPLHGLGLTYPRADTRTVTIPVVAPGVNTATGDGKAYFPVPAGYSGAIIVSAHALVTTAGTTGTTDIQVARVRAGTPADVLSTKLTIDSAETGSDTAAAAAVINATNDDLLTNDVLRIDVDAVSTTPAQGLFITLEVTK